MELGDLAKVTAPLSKKAGISVPPAPIWQFKGSPWHRRQQEERERTPKRNVNANWAFWHWILCCLLLSNVCAHKRLNFSCCFLTFSWGWHNTDVWKSPPPLSRYLCWNIPIFLSYIGTLEFCLKTPKDFLHRWIITQSTMVACLTSKILNNNFKNRIRSR